MVELLNRYYCRTCAFFCVMKGYGATLFQGVVGAVCFAYRCFFVVYFKVERMLITLSDILSFCCCDVRDFEVFPGAETGGAFII